MTKRWSGTARVEDGEVMRVRFERDGDETVAWIGEREFALETTEGRIEIDLSNDAVKILPEKERSGAWELFESEPFARPFLSSAPGPHVHVKLSVATIRDGDQVVVDGDADEDDDEQVRARLVAAGDTATSVVERIDATERAHAPKRTRARPPFGFATITTVFAITAIVVAIAIPLGPATLDLAAFAAAMIAMTLHRLARGVIVFRSSKGRIDRTPFGAVFSFSVGGTCFLFGVLAVFGDWPGRMNDGSQENSSAMPLLMWSVYLGLLVVDLVRSGRHSERLSRAALAAPALAVGRWGSIIGNVRSHEEKAAVYSLIEETWWEGSGSNPRAETQHQSPFVIQVGDNRSVRVVPHNQACWATDAIEQSSERATSATQKAIVERSEIPRGARVLAVGRAKLDGDDEVLAPTGPESLILFASEGGEPRRVLRRRRALWMFALLVIGTFAIASAALAVIQPGMPPSNVRDSN